MISMASGSALIASAGTASPVAGAFFVEGISQTGLGLTMFIDGLVSNPSEQTEYVKNNMPVSISDALAKSGDIIVGTENNEIKEIVSFAKSILDFSVSPSYYEKALKTMSVIEISIDSSIIIVSDTPM